MIRALHIVGQLEPGGVSTWLRTLLQAADRRELAIDIICNFRTTPGILMEEFQRTGATVRHLPLTGAVVPYTRGLRSLVRRENYRIIHDHRSYFAGPSLRAAKAAGCLARIAYHHGPDDGHIKGIVRGVYHRLFQRWLWKYATHIWGCSRATLDGQYGTNWQALDPRFGVVYGVVAPPKPAPGAREKIRREFGVPPGAKIIGFVGRVTRHKNPLHALACAHKVLSECDTAYFMVAGEGPLLANMKAAARTCPHASRTIFAGVRGDVPDILAALDIFYQPSISEGFPLGTLEALHMGLPVVGSNVPGLLEALPRDMHGLCFDPGDAKGQAAAMIKIIREGWHKAAPREFLDQFTPEKLYGRILEEYRKAVGEEQ
jgi:glycosyltransferase involved in cell wall biosynthesis